MKYKYFCFTLSIAFCFSIIMKAQDGKTTSMQWLKIDNELLYNIVIATDVNQKITKGLLYGMKGDSIYLTIKNEMIKLNVRGLLTLSIEDRRISNRGLVFGAIGGMYVGTILFLTSKEEPAKYLEYYDDEIGVFALYEILFAGVGGSLGYLIDRSIGDQYKVFYFNQADEGIDNEIEKLEDFLTNNSKSKKMKINFHLSQVGTRISEIKDKSMIGYYSGGYYGSYNNQLHSFNMLRKISLTYEVLDQLEVGFSISLFGEPSFDYFKSDSRYDTTYIYTTNTIRQSYEGSGYYIIVNYKPLRNIIPEYFDILLGVGMGLGKVSYNYVKETVTQISYNDPVVVTKEAIIDEMLFSSIISGEMKFFLYPELSVSLQADYIYIPKEIPSIPEFEIEERSLGNFSFGIGVGFNF